MSQNQQIYRGHCHCGAVQFEATLDLSKGASRCNCTICIRVGSTSVAAKPEALRIVAGAEQLSEYRVGNSPNYRKFCRRCGNHVYGGGHVPELGGDFVSVNVNCLEDVELSELRIGYWDGRHDNWSAGVRERPWPVLSAG